MSSIEKLIEVARAEVGYVESANAQHPNGNVTKYWAELDPAEQGQPWCAAFVSWCFKRAGAPLPAVDRSYGYINTADMHRWAQRNGKVISPAHAGPGDIVLLYGDEHTELVTSSVGYDGSFDGSFSTIGGNTSSGINGSQTNGGGVYARIRHVVADRAVFVRPLLLPASEPAVIRIETSQVEVEVQLQLNKVTFTTGANGEGNVTVPVSIDKVVSIVSPGLRPNVDKQYLEPKVGEAEEADHIVLSVEGWAPKTSVTIRVWSLA